MFGNSHKSEEQEEALTRCISSVFDEALDRVRREQSELSSEQTAFETFGEKIDYIEPASLQMSTSHITNKNTQEEPIEQVQTAYRETVLSVPHFDREYSESYVENIQAEFGSNLASALHPKTSVQFTPLLKQTLLEATNRCTATRAALLEDIDRELNSLRRSQDELSDILDRFDTAQHIEHYKSGFIKRLESVATARQQVIQRHYSLQSLDGHHLHEYLYSQKSWNYPVLFAISRLREAWASERG